MRDVLDLVARVAKTSPETTVIIYGETGVGKDKLALARKCAGTEKLDRKSRHPGR